MPKLRRLSGKDIVKELQKLGFEIYSQTGSHCKMRRIIDGKDQSVIVAVHANKTLKPGTIKGLYHDLSPFLSKDQLNNLFYTD
jgi:predicted RNA binding protein YcfA (HicA-like mRNA interferase family)